MPAPCRSLQWTQQARAPSPGNDVSLALPELEKGYERRSQRPCQRLPIRKRLFRREIVKTRAGGARTAAVRRTKAWPDLGAAHARCNKRSMRSAVVHAKTSPRTLVIGRCGAANLARDLLLMVGAVSSC